MNLMNLPGIYELFTKHWQDKQTVWIYSDTHFGDEELQQGIKKRPLDEDQVKMINSCVGKKDILIHLGDVGNIEMARKLKGYKILICGNHDAGKSNYSEVFDEIYTGALILGERIILSHEPIPNLNWAMNLHGHVHKKNSNDKFHFNCCADVINYKPINFNQWLKEGHLANIESIHRQTIDRATRRKNNGRKRY